MILWLLSLIRLPLFIILDLRAVPSQTQGFSHTRVPSSLWMPLSPAYLLPPPSGLYRQTNPLTFLRGLRHVLMCPIPFASTSPSLCSKLSLGVFCSLISLRVSFCNSLRGQGASTHWQSLSQALSPMILGHVIAIQDTSTPTSPTSAPCPSSLVHVIPYPLVQGIVS